MAEWQTMTIRAYTPDDFATVEQWAKARNMALVPQLLSPNGFLVDDEEGPVMAAWVYLIYDCPRVSIDDFYGRPGASAGRLRKAWGVLQSAIFSFLSKLRDCQEKPLDYAIVSTFADEALATILKADGWHVGTKPHVHVLKPISYVS